MYISEKFTKYVFTQEKNRERKAFLAGLVFIWLIFVWSVLFKNTPQRRRKEEEETLVEKELLTQLMFVLSRTPRSHSGLTNTNVVALLQQRSSEIFYNDLF